MKRIILASVVLLSGIFMAQGQDKLPEISLTNTDGDQVDVAEYGNNEKITVLNFWATWCTPCKKELNNIAEMYEDWQDDYNVEVIAVSIDDAKTTSRVKAYVNGQAWDYDVLLDSNQDLKRALNFQTVPFTIVVDQEGNIVDRHTGYVEGDEYELEEKIAELAE